MTCFLITAAATFASRAMIRPRRQTARLPVFAGNMIGHMMLFLRKFQLRAAKVKSVICSLCGAKLARENGSLCRAKLAVGNSLCGAKLGWRDGSLCRAKLGWRGGSLCGAKLAKENGSLCRAKLALLVENFLKKVSPPSPLTKTFMYFLCVVTLCCHAQRTVFSNSGGKIRTLDPIHADDLASRDLLGAIFDTLVEYDYTQRPYSLKPSMVKVMPLPSHNFTQFHFSLRNDLMFPKTTRFPERKITPHDIKYSLLRLADSRLNSPLYWLVRGKIKGFDEFHKLSASTPEKDFAIYDNPVPGFVIHNDSEFTITLNHSDPAFLYRLALPNAAIVRREAVEKFPNSFGRNPHGSGPFVLQKWINDYKVVLVRNPHYRFEVFDKASNPSDRSRPLPLADKIEIALIRQPMTSYLMFLRGDIDFHSLDKDKADVTAPGGNLAPALKKRKIHLISFPEFEIRYVGFNFKDPLLAGNKKLRAALSLAYNVRRRVKFTNNQLIPVQSPIPPGVKGFDPLFRNPNASCNLEKARKLLAEAGFPNGIDPSTNSPLVLTFDQSGTTTTHRQYGELAAADFAKLGIKVVSVLNNKPRFYEKLRQGKTQLFRLSWIGDYPDAENFLQLFYSKNSGGCNRCQYSNPEFDRLYEKLSQLPDSPERVSICRKMVDILTADCVWIHEGIPLSWQLKHDWLENFHPHDFAFIRWKYISVDPQKRERLKKTFTPLGFKDLQAK